MYPHICVKKVCLVSLIALIVIVACTSASASDAQEKAGFHFMQYYNQKNNMNGTGYYVLSESKFTLSVNGDIIILGGNAVFEGNITGNIFVFGADVTFLSEATIYGDVIFLSSNIAFKKGVTHVGETKQAISLFSFLLQNYELSDCVVFKDTQPYYTIFLSFGIIQMIIGFVLVSFMKNFLSQGSVVLMKQTKSVLIKGFSLYFILVALIIIFVWSVIGFPIALLLCFIYIIIIYLGQVSLAIAIGLIVNLNGFGKDSAALKPTFWGFIRKNNVYLYFFIGTVFIELIKLLPFVNIVINFILLPVVCFGVIAATFLNTYVLRIYFSMPFLQKNNKHDLCNDKIRDIIIKDIQ